MEFSYAYTASNNFSSAVKHTDIYLDQHSYLDANTD
jgi:hypothetical protein